MRNLDRFVSCDDAVISQVQVIRAGMTNAGWAGLQRSLIDLMTILLIFLQVAFYTKNALATAAFIY